MGFNQQNGDLMVIYPLVICYEAIGNDHRNSWFTFLEMVIFHSYGPMVI